MDHAIQAAIACFPDREDAIAELAGKDENFQSLCEDLAEAEAVLARWEHSSEPLKAERCSEYRDLVRDLAAEIAAELNRHAQDRRLP